MITEILPADISRLDEWWRRRSYPGDPFVASKAEDAELEQLQDWHIDCPWPSDLPRRGIDTLATVISKGDSRLVLIYAPTGGGKTFYRRVAAQLCREDINSRGALEISITDLNRAGMSGQNGLSPDRLAVCVRDKILANHPQTASLTETHPPPSAEDSGYILAQCADLAASFNRERGRAKLYIFLDDLDKLYNKLSRQKHSATTEAIADFLSSVAGGACGEYIAMRVFLPLELHDPLQQALDLNLRTSILLVKLSWTLKSCEEVVERRFETAWIGGHGPERGHLGSFLTPDAQDAFRRMLKGRERQESLSPRDAIEIISLAANYAAGHGINDQPISEKMYRQSQKARGVRTRLQLPRKSWPLVLLLLGSTFLLWRYPQIRKDLMALLLSFANVIRLIIQWLIGIQDWIEAFLLLVVVLGAGIFVSWCLMVSYRSGERPDMRRCLQKAWQLVRQRLPGSF